MSEIIKVFALFAHHNVSLAFYLMGNLLAKLVQLEKFFLVMIVFRARKTVQLVQFYQIRRRRNALVAVLGSNSGLTNVRNVRQAALLVLLTQLAKLFALLVFPLPALL